MKATLSLLILTLSLSAFSQSEVKYCNYLFKSCATIDPATCAIAELPTENALLDCQNIVLEQIPFFKAEGEKIGTKYAALSEKISAIVRNESEGQFKKMYTDASSKLLETATQYQNLNAPFWNLNLNVLTKDSPVLVTINEYLKRKLELDRKLSEATDPDIISAIKALRQKELLGKLGSIQQVLHVYHEARLELDRSLEEKFPRHLGLPNITAYGVKLECKQYFDEKFSVPSYSNQGNANAYGFALIEDAKVLKKMLNDKKPMTMTCQKNGPALYDEAENTLHMGYKMKHHWGNLGNSGWDETVFYIKNTIAFLRQELAD